MKLYVVRHGETLANTLKKVSGDKESPLTKVGISQAKELALEFQDINFDIVFSSPLLRALDTARLITNKRVYIDERLIERNYGENEGKYIKDTNPKELWNYNLNTDFADCETVQEVLERTKSFLEDIKMNHPDATILVVTHSGVARGIYYYFNKIPKNGDLTEVELANCEYQIYEL